MLVNVSKDGREVWARPIATNLPDFDAETRYVDGELVELRIFQSRKDGPAITASGVLRRISTEVLRENTFNAIAAADHRPVEVCENGRRYQLEMRDDTQLYQDAASEGRKRARGRRPGWTPERLALLAARYEELLRLGAPQPYNALTKEFKLASPTAARGAIQKATALQLWKPNGKGRRGGSLTPRARRLVRERKQR